MFAAYQIPPEVELTIISSFSNKHLHDFILRGVSGKLAYRIALNTLFARQGKEACNYQDDLLGLWLHALANPPGTLSFIKSDEDKIYWRKIILKRMKDPKASRSFKFRCISFVNKMLPQEQQTSKKRIDAIVKSLVVVHVETSNVSPTQSEVWADGVEALRAYMPELPLHSIWSEFERAMSGQASHSDQLTLTYAAAACGPYLADKQEKLCKLLLWLIDYLFLFGANSEMQRGTAQALIDLAPRCTAETADTVFKKMAGKIYYSTFKTYSNATKVLEAYRDQLSRDHIDAHVNLYSPDLKSEDAFKRGTAHMVFATLAPRCTQPQAEAQIKVLLEHSDHDPIRMLALAAFASRCSDLQVDTLYMMFKEDFNDLDYATPDEVMLRAVCRGLMGLVSRCTKAQQRAILEELCARLAVFSGIAIEVCPLLELLIPKTEEEHYETIAKSLFVLDKYHHDERVFRARAHAFGVGAEHAQKPQRDAGFDFLLLGLNSSGSVEELGQARLALLGLVGLLPTCSTTQVKLLIPRFCEKLHSELWGISIGLEALAQQCINVELGDSFLQELLKLDFPKMLYFAGDALDILASRCTNPALRTQLFTALCTQLSSDTEKLRRTAYGICMTMLFNAPDLDDLAAGMFTLQGENLEVLNVQFVEETLRAVETPQPVVAAETSFQIN